MWRTLPEATRLSKGLLDRSKAVVHMEPVEVDVVGLHATERLLALCMDRLVTSTTAIRITGVYVAEKLPGQHHSLAAGAVLGNKVADIAGGT